MKGGYRPGSGRPKGIIETKPRKKSEAQEEAEKIRQMLALGMQAKKKFYHEFLVRVANQDKKQVPLSIAEKNLMNKLAIELAAELKDPAEPGESEGLDPLTYMLRVMNDTKEDPAVRRQMAAAAAPYCHPRKGEGEGKKEGKAERAVEAGKGKFRAGRAPLALVK